MNSERKEQSNQAEFELDFASSALCSAETPSTLNDLSLQALLSENTLLKTALAFMPLGICVFDEQDRLLLCNQQYLDIWSLPACLGQRGTLFTDIMAASHGKEIELPDQPRLGTRGQRRREFVTETGVRIQVLVHVLDDKTVVALHKDITQSHETQERIAFLASHDALTGLCNRATLYDELYKSLQPDSASANLTLLYLDLDSFKQVNDSMGHPVGDKLLHQVSERLQECCRSTDLVARLGGDEFAILMDPEETCNKEGSVTLSRKIIASVCEPFHVDGRQIQIGVSIGIAFTSSRCRTVEDLLKNADMALYEAKSRGGNFLQAYDQELDERVREQQSFKVDLGNALKNDEFELYYQTQVNASTMALCGVEALIRWNHPSRGLIHPDEFIPLAESTGLVIPIGRWVLQQACLEATRWPDHITVAVNVSSVQLSGSDLLDDVDMALAASKLPACRLELEITESVIMEDVSATQALLHELKLRGVSIAIDDFGTGFSSLQYLRSFPVDKLKIDRSFVAGVDTEPETLPIIRAIVDLGNHLGKQTIAEGVENRDQLEILQQLGCNEVQGYLISRPSRAEEIMDLHEFSGSSQPHQCSG